MLEQIPLIYYLVMFYKNKEIYQAFLYLDNVINVITLSYVAVLGLWVCSITVGVLKINASIFSIYKIVIVSF